MKYLDLYEYMYADIVFTNRFDENSDLSTTYLGWTKKIETQNSKQRKGFLSQDKALHQESYWMELTVRFY